MFLFITQLGQKFYAFVTVDFRTGQITDINFRNSLPQPTTKNNIEAFKEYIIESGSVWSNMLETEGDENYRFPTYEEVMAEGE